MKQNMSAGQIQDCKCLQTYVLCDVLSLNLSFRQPECLGDRRSLIIPIILPPDGRIKALFLVKRAKNLYMKYTCEYIFRYIYVHMCVCVCVYIYIYIYYICTVRVFTYTTRSKHKAHSYIYKDYAYINIHIHTYIQVYGKAGLHMHIHT
jgi:hypothetical protein